MLGNRAATHRWIDNLKLPYPDSGYTAIAWQSPYRVWAWKQNELFRQIFEAQMEHLRKVYRRQWFEAYRVNADEYISVYNRTKAAQYAKWEQEMLEQDKKRRQEFFKYQARNRLHEKQREILREYYTKHFFYWFERASERLQSMETMKWVTKENLSQHIEKELEKYVSGTATRFPLNFVGQMPLIEDNEGNIVEAPPHMAHWYNFTESSTGIHAADTRKKTTEPLKIHYPPSSGEDGAPVTGRVNVSQENAWKSTISTELEPFDIGKAQDVSSAEEVDPKLYGDVQHEMDASRYSTKTENVDTERSMKDLLEEKERSLSRERMGARRFVETKRKGKARDEDDDSNE